MARVLTQAPRGSNAAAEAQAVQLLRWCVRNDKPSAMTTATLLLVEQHIDELKLQVAELRQVPAIREGY